MPKFVLVDMFASNSVDSTSHIYTFIRGGLDNAAFESLI